ncbi:MAG: hypothetical protein ACKOYI_10885, partial [Actinomycetota bacterium]
MFTEQLVNKSDESVFDRHLFDIQYLQSVDVACRLRTIAAMIETSGNDITINAAFELTQHEIQVSGLSQLYANNLMTYLDDLKFLLLNCGATYMSQVTESDLRAYLGRPVHRCGTSSPPERTTQRGRKSVVSKLYETLMRHGYSYGNPLALERIPAPPRGVPTLPTDGEVDLLKAAAPSLGVCSRNSLIIGLALSGSTSHEIAVLRIRDIDIDSRTIQLPGHRRINARINKIDAWCLDDLISRVQVARQPLERLVTTAEDVSSASSSISNA